MHLCLSVQKNVQCMNILKCVFDNNLFLTKINHFCAAFPMDSFSIESVLNQAKFKGRTDGTL